MSDLIPVTPDAFANRFWKRYRDYHFARARGTVPLGLGELREVAALLPIAFTDDGAPVILLGMDAGCDYVDPDTGGWALPYVPAALRAYPFEALPKDGNMMVMFDQSSGLTSGVPTDEPFFLPGGDVAPPLAQVIAFLKARHGTYTQAHTAGRALAEAGVLVPLALRGHLSQTRIQGLLQVSPARLAALPETALPALWASHALSLAEAHLVSLQHCDRKIAVAQGSQALGPDPGGDGSVAGGDLSGFLDALAAAQDHDTA